MKTWSVIGRESDLPKAKKRLDYQQNGADLSPDMFVSNCSSSDEGEESEDDNEKGN